MARRGWICESCGKGGFDLPWDCPGCKKEVCEHCFYNLAHCKKCSKGKTDRELEIAANKEGWDF